MIAHDEIAREKKAHRIADLIWAHLTDDQREDPELLDCVAERPQGEWNAWATASSPETHRQRPPSEKTKDRVIGILREKQARLLGTDRCGICQRPVAPSPEPSLCPWCAATARAAGRQANDARRYPDPEPRHAGVR